MKAYRVFADEYGNCVAECTTYTEAEALAMQYGERSTNGYSVRVWENGTLRTVRTYKRSDFE